MVQQNILLGKEATASENTPAFQQDLLERVPPSHCASPNPQRDLPVRKAEGTSNTTIQTLGARERTGHPSVSPSAHSTAALPQGGGTPICSCPLRTICYNKITANNNSSRRHLDPFMQLVLSGVLKDQSVGSAELLLSATAKLGQQQNLRPFSTRVTLQK